MSHRLCLLIVFAIFVSPSTLWGQVNFESDIKPIFENHCIACHGAEDPEAFRIDQKGDAISYIEETAEDSQLYTSLVSDDSEELMPPPGSTAKPLTEAQISLVKAWINEGAEWPDELESKWENVPLPDAEDSQLPFRAAGSLHPALVHLPIGLLLAAGLFAFLSLRGNFVMSDCAYYCLWLGALGAIFACVSGWFFSEVEGYGTVDEVADVLNQNSPMFWHRITGLGATVFAVILALFAANSRNKDPDDGFMWKLALIVLACAIGWVGKTGGELHYPKDHYKDLNTLFQSFFPEATREDGDRTIEETDEEEAKTEADADSDIQPLTTDA